MRNYTFLFGQNVTALLLRILEALVSKLSLDIGNPAEFFRCFS